MSDEALVERLISLVQRGTSIDRAETEVGQPDGWARPAVVAWCRDRGMGYAAAARHLALPLNTVKAWYRRHAPADPPPAPAQPLRRAPTNVVPMVEPRSGPAPAGRRRSAEPEDGARHLPPDFATMGREAFLAWLVDDIGGRLFQARERDAGTVPQLVSQLRAARTELDTFRAELKRERGLDLGHLSEDELKDKMRELAERLPDVFLEVYVQAYLTRHKLRVGVNDAGAA